MASVIKETQVEAPPPTAEYTVFVNSAQGRKFAILDPSIVVTSGATPSDPPTISAVGSGSPIVPQEKLYHLVVTADNEVVTLPAVPVPPILVKVFRNGMLQLESVDYVIVGTVITFLPLLFPVPTIGDNIAVFYG